MIIVLFGLMLHNELSIEGLILTLSIGIGYGVGFTVNDYFDRSIDKYDTSKVNKNYFIYNSHNIGLFVIFSSLLILLFVAASYGMKGFVIYIVAILAFWSYSAKPFRFKNRTGLDLLIHGTFIETYPYFIMLLFLDLNWMLIDYFVLTILFLNSIVNQIGQQLRDFHFDSLISTNFTIKYGEKNARLIYLVLNFAIILLGILSVFSKQITGSSLLVIIIVSPLFIRRLSTSYNTNKPEKMYKFTIAIVLFYLFGLYSYTNFL